MGFISNRLLLIITLLISQAAVAQYDPDYIEPRKTFSGKAPVSGDSIHFHVLLNTMPTLIRLLGACELEGFYTKDRLTLIGVVGVHAPGVDSPRYVNQGNIQQKAVYIKGGAGTTHYITKIKRDKERERYLSSSAGFTLLYLKERNWGAIPGSNYGDLPFEYTKQQVDGALWGRIEYGWFVWNNWVLAANIDLSVRLFRTVNGKEEFNTLFYPGIGINFNGSSVSSASWLYPRVGLKVGYRLR